MIGWRRTGWALTLWALVACGDGQPSLGPGDDVVAQVEVTAPTAQMEAGGTIQMAARARSASGDVLAGRTVTWSSGDSTVARVTSTGLVTGLRAGAVAIDARIEGKKGTLQVQVTTNPAPTVQTLVPSVAVVGGAGMTVSIRGAGFVPGGQVTWAGATRTPVWVSGSELRLDLSAGDLASVGDAEVRVVNPGPGGGTSPALTFAIRPVPVAFIDVTPGEAWIDTGDTIRITAIVLDSLGHPLDDRAVTWSSGADGTATVSDDGLVTGVGVGFVEITASVEGKANAATVHVMPRLGPTITSLSPDSLPARGDGVTITIRGTGFTSTSAGVLGSTRPTDFVSSTELVMHFWPGDLATNGVRQIRVYDPVGQLWSNTVPLLVRGITRVDVTGQRDLWTGELARVTAAGTDAEGTVYPPQPVQWTSSRPDIVSVDAQGAIRGVAAGSAIVTATMAGVQGAIQVRVHAPPAWELLFSMTPGDTHVPELFRMAPGRNAPPARILPVGTRAVTPAASRDGTRVAFSGSDGQIWIANVDGSGLRRVTRDSLPKDEPAWSPDGTRLVFRARNGPHTEVGIVGVDGSGQRILTWPEPRFGTAVNEEPTWTPDGQRIVWVEGELSYPWGNRLLSMAPDGSGRTRLTEGGNPDTDPAYSPNGDLLAVARTWRTPALGQRPTFLRPDGSPAAILETPGIGHSPSWSPDGAWLAYVGQDFAGDLIQLVVTRPNDRMQMKIIRGVADPVWIRAN